MITAGGRFWFAVSGLGVAGAVVYLASGGEELGTLILLFAALAALVPGLTMVVLRDGDVPVPPPGPSADQAGQDGAGQEGKAEGEAEGEAQGEAALRVAAPRVAAPAALPTGWPALGALGAGVVVVGLAAGGALFYVGLAVLGAVLAEWMVQGWAERATPDPATNRQLRNRVMFPVEIPALAAIGVAGVVLAFSRVLLALPQAGSTVTAIAVASAILFVASVLATRPHLSSSVVAAVAVLGALALLGGGVVAAVAGEREVAEHEEGTEGAGVAPEVVVAASSDQDFDVDEITIPAGETVRIVFENNDQGTPHNLDIQGIEGVAPTEIITGVATASVEVTVDQAGRYTYVCDVHPATMMGTLVVEGG